MEANSLTVETTRPRWYRSARLLVIASFITILGFGAVCASILYDMRRGEEDLAKRGAENLAATIDADVSRNIEVLDLSLRNVVINVLSPEVKAVTPAVRNLILFDHAATARHFGALQVFDETGKLTIDATTFDPPPQSVADEEFFTIHRDNAAIGLFISRPMLYRSAFSVVLSRRVSGPDGAFRGVVAGAIRFSFFHELFGRLKLSPGDLISVVRRDGMVIMRLPFDLDMIGTNVSHLAATRHALKNPEGNDGGFVLGNTNRLFVWRGSGPLIVMVGKPWSAIYDVWREQAMRIGAIMAVLMFVAAIATLFLSREIRRRTRAEQTLELLATTDSLTGLRNRREFDRRLEAEWQRGVREFAPVSLLLFDVDHFKALNDRFGHQTGDKALAAIASCILQSVLRPRDCAARYGGEEFALLLPGIGRAEALSIAEAIRNSVARCAEMPMPMTISVGAATLTPGQGTLPALLVELADRALYEAKRAGRNRTVMAGARRSAELVA